MMAYSWGGAIVGGLVGTFAMTLVMLLAKRMGMVRMDIARMLGTMFMEDSSAARAAGLMMHFVNGAIFGLIYMAILYAGRFTPSWWVGLLFGFVHWLFFGVFMGMLPAVHPRVASGTAAVSGAGAGPVSRRAGRAEVLPAPGPFAVQYGLMDALGGALMHLIFGIVTIEIIGQFWHP